MTAERFTGLALRLRRVERQVRVGELAEQMGVKPSRISHLENAARVTPAAAQKYLEALATLETVTTPTEAA
jgi:predicted transcriptional regulator